MATREPTPRDLTSEEELEQTLVGLREQVDLRKEEVRNSFQQFHDLLAERETSLLQEMDEIVIRAGQEITDKRTNLQELYTAREGIERDLTQNRFKGLLENNLRAIEKEIGEEVARVNVGWIELDWKREQLEQSVSEVCKVVTLKERPPTPIDYSARKCPMWSRDGTGSDVITDPHQLAIEDKTQNIFVIDCQADRIQVFDGEGNHLYQIPTPRSPVGIAFSDEYIFVSTQNELLKIEKANNQSIESVRTQNRLYGIDTNSNTDIYGCEFASQSIVVFDKVLKFQKRIKLRTTRVSFGTETRSIKLYDDEMYVMFCGLLFSPPFHLQIFNLEGQVVKCLIGKKEIGSSHFFSIDRLGNIIVADWWGNQLKIFSKEGEVIHTITSAMLPGQMAFRPRGVAIDKQNRLIVAQMHWNCNLLVF